MTLPQINILSTWWRATPPPAVQLRRIAQYLGLPDPKPPEPPARAPADALREALAAGLPVMEGRPDDPMLALIGL